MTSAAAHALLERLIARALRAPDPALAIARVAHDRRLPPRLRRAAAVVDEDGFRLAALLVARLRFERLLRGSPGAEAWHERDAAGFAAAFRRYHQAIPSRALFPGAEARAFAAYIARGARRARLTACAAATYSPAT